MVAVQAGMIGPQADGTTPQQNPLDVERHAYWSRFQRSGIVKGLVPSVVAGQMQLSFTPGSAVVCERDGSQTELDRAYPLYSSGTAVVQFQAASVGVRNDAVVAAVVDVEDGAQGSGTLGVGGHLVAVPGTSGSSTPRTDAQIAAYLGRGGFHRLYDVPIGASPQTQINLAGATFTGLNLFDWNLVLPQPSLASGWAYATNGQFKYRFLLPNWLAVRGIVQRTGSAATSNSEGNITPDISVIASGGWPAALRPAQWATAFLGAQVTFTEQGKISGRGRIEPDGSVLYTELGPPSQTQASNANLLVEGQYALT
jgi:hypothetical protein